MSIVLQVNKSNISGLGLFTLNAIKQNTVLFPLFQVDVLNRITGQEFEPTNWLNHSYNNNIMPVHTHNIVYAVAKTNILPNTELTANYNDYNQYGLKTILQQIEQNPNYYQQLYNNTRHKIPARTRQIGHIYKL